MERDDGLVVYTTSRIHRWHTTQKRLQCGIVGQNEGIMISSCGLVASLDFDTVGAIDFIFFFIFVPAAIGGYFVAFV